MSFQDDQSVEDRLRPVNPRVTGKMDDYEDYEELYPVEEYTLTTLDKILLAARCAIVLLFVVTFILVRIRLQKMTHCSLPLAFPLNFMLLMTFAAVFVF